MLMQARKPLIVRRGDVARELRALGFKLLDHDAIHAWILPGIGAQPFDGAVALAGYTTTFTTPGGPTNEPIPTNAVQCIIKIWGATASGGKSALSTWTASGSGGGGYTILTKPVLPGEWGNNLAVTLGAGGAAKTTNGVGNNGGNSTVTGTLNGGAIAPAVACSTPGNQTAGGGAGGVASGGDTNQNGAAGGTGDSASVCGAGGAGATLTGPTSGGAGGNRGGGSGGGYTNGNAGGTDSGAGIDARIEITWS